MCQACDTTRIIGGALRDAGERTNDKSMHLLGLLLVSTSDHPDPDALTDEEAARWTQGRREKNIELVREAGVQVARRAAAIAQSVSGTINGLASHCVMCTLPPAVVSKLTALQDDLSAGMPGVEARVREAQEEVANELSRDRVAIVVPLPSEN